MDGLDGNRGNRKCSACPCLGDGGRNGYFPGMQVNVAREKLEGLPRSNARVQGEENKGIVPEAREGGLVRGFQEAG